jgi:hypothetical protein
VSSTRRAPIVGLAGLVFAGVALFSRGAVAQFDAGLSGPAPAFAPSDFLVGVQGVLGTDLSDYDVVRFFNKARCDCSQTVWIDVSLLSSGVSKVASVQQAAPNGRVEFWVGSDCSNPLLRAQSCQLLGVGSETLNSFILKGHTTIVTNARTLSTYPSARTTAVDGGTTTNIGFPPTGNPDCTAPIYGQFAQTIWVLVSNTGTLTYDTVFQRNVFIDLSPPPEPDPNSITVEGGDEALMVGWQKLDTSVYPDLIGYQVLCNRGGSLQVFDSGSFSPGFTSAVSLVGSGQVTTDMCVSSAPGTGIEALDPNYVCSPLLSTSTSSYRIKILQNQIVYGVSVLAVDASGNASQPPDIFYGTPTGSTQSLRGAATGGCCAVAPESGPSATTIVVALACGGVAIALARRRRRPSR